jgi:hypothetical protein
MSGSRDDMNVLTPRGQLRAHRAHDVSDDQTIEIRNQRRRPERSNQLLTRAVATQRAQPDQDACTRIAEQVGTA